MTTFKYAIELDDNEVIALRAALALLEDESHLQIEIKKQAAPWMAYVRTIARIRTKLADGAQHASSYHFY